MSRSAAIQSGIPRIFDRDQVRKNRIRCRQVFHNHDFICDLAGREVADRLLDIRKEFATGIMNGAGRLSPETLSSIARNGGVQTLVTTDILAGQEQDLVLAEEELPFGKDSLDFIGSFLTLHTANDLPGALIQINYALRPDGLFLGAMFGGETLYELRQAMIHTETRLKGGVTPRVMPFADKQQMGALLQRAGFALPVVDSDIIEVTYNSLHDLLYDVRGMGESNVVSDRPLACPGKGFFQEVEKTYREHFADPQGKLTARFEIIYLIGWAPHATQQQPLRPGSAESSLAEALGTQEQETGVPVEANRNKGERE